MTYENISLCLPLFTTVYSDEVHETFILQSRDEYDQHLKGLPKTLTSQIQLTGGKRAMSRVSRTR